MIDRNFVHLLFSLQLLIGISAATNERQIGLGSALNPDNPFGAIKIASGLSKVAGVSENVMGTTMKFIDGYSPIVMPHASDAKVEPTISLDDKRLKMHLPQEKIDEFVKLIGLDSPSMSWKAYNCPLSFYQVKTICTRKHSSSSGISIMPMDSYLPKLVSSMIADDYYKILSSNIESDMDQEDFDERVEELDQRDEGLVVLQVTIKPGALSNLSKGSIVLLCLGKFPPDKKLSEPPTIMPVILIGTIKHVSPVQSKPEPVIPAQTPTSTSNTMNESASEPEEADILEVQESPLDPEGLNIPTSSQVGTITSSQSSSSAQTQAKVQSQPQPQFQPQSFPGPQTVSHLPPPRPGRPPRPPQQQQNFQRPQPQPFDGRQPNPHQRPMPRPQAQG